MVIAVSLIVYKIGFYAAIVLFGYIGGFISGVKLAPPTEDVEIKVAGLKIKVRGKGNVVTDGMDITDTAVINKAKKKTRKERVAARKASKKSSNQ